jgi:hypothetical protein
MMASIVTHDHSNNQLIELRNSIRTMIYREERLKEFPGETPVYISDVWASVFLTYNVDRAAMISFLSDVKELM